MLFNKTITDPAGNILPNTSCTVYLLQTNAPASIFSDVGLSMPLANPTMTDSNGVLTFYADPDFYFIIVNKIGISNQDPIRFFDINDLVTVFQTLVLQATTAATAAASSAAEAAAYAALLGQIVEDVIIASWGGPVTIQPNGSKIYKVTLTSPVTLTIDMSTWPVGKGGGIIIRATGSHAVTWPGNVRWPNGTPPMLTSSWLVSLVTVDGLTFDGTLGGVAF